MHGFVDSAEELETKCPRQMIEYTMLHCLLLLALHFISLKREREKKDSARQLQSDQWEIYSPREYSQDNCSFVQRPDHAGPHHSNL